MMLSSRNELTSAQWRIKAEHFEGLYELAIGELAATIADLEAKEAECEALLQHIKQLELEVVI